MCLVKEGQRVIGQAREVEAVTVIQVEVFGETVEAIDNVQASSAVKIQAAIDGMVVEEIEGKCLLGGFQ